MGKMYRPNRLLGKCTVEKWYVYIYVTVSILGSMGTYKYIVVNNVSLVGMKENGGEGKEYENKGKQREFDCFWKG